MNTDSILAAFAQQSLNLTNLRSQAISKQTKAALEIRRAQGIRLGRPRSLPEEVVQRVASERKSGRTLAAIANDLNDDGTPTAQGGLKWYPSTIAAVLKSIERDQEAISRTV